MTEWASNDELFFSELKKGFAWQNLPATYFQLHGLEVSIPKLMIRDSISDAPEWLNTVDLIVNEVPLEVKSRDEIFTSPESFPYSTIFVDTVSGFDAKVQKPAAYIMISRPTGTMLALASNTYKNWVVEERFDNVRKIRDKFYLAPKALLRPMNNLVKFLKTYENKSTPTA